MEKAIEFIDMTVKFALPQLVYEDANQNLLK